MGPGRMWVVVGWLGGGGVGDGDWEAEAAVVGGKGAFLGGRVSKGGRGVGRLWEACVGA